MPERVCHFGWFAAVRGIESGYWISPTEASDLTGVSPRTLRNWCREGVVSYIQWGTGKHRSYMREELQELVNVLGDAPTLWMIRDYIASQLVEVKHGG